MVSRWIQGDYSHILRKGRWYVTDEYTLDSFQLNKNLSNTHYVNGITYIDKNNYQLDSTKRLQVAQNSISHYFSRVSKFVLVLYVLSRYIYLG